MTIISEEKQKEFEKNKIQIEKQLNTCFNNLLTKELKRQTHWALYSLMGKMGAFIEEFISIVAGHENSVVKEDELRNDLTHIKNIIDLILTSTPITEHTTPWNQSIYIFHKDRKDTESFFEHCIICHHNVSTPDKLETDFIPIYNPFHTEFVMGYVCKHNLDCKRKLEVELLNFNKYNKLRTQLQQLKDTKYSE